MFLSAIRDGQSNDIGGRGPPAKASLNPGINASPQSGRAVHGTVSDGQR